MKNFLKTYQNFLFLVSILFFISVAAYFVYSYFYQSMPQSAIYFLNEAQKAEKGQKVLVISPHPDDETIGCGGYIYDAEKAEAEVKIVLVTDGDKHGLKEKRYDEFKKVTSVLNVAESNLVFLNYADGKLKEISDDSLEQRLSQIYQGFKPDIVFAPGIDDSHPDHSKVGATVAKMLAKEKFNGLVYNYLIHYPNYPRPVKYSPDLYLLPPIRLATFDNEWLKYDLSDEAEDAKNRAILSYDSQLHTPFLRGLMLSSIRKNEIFLNGIK